MKILVTGGAGFIGSNFIRYWLNHHPKDKIINLDKLTYAGHLGSTKDFASNKNYEFVEGDICSEALIDVLMKKVDTVVNFAAESHVDRSIDGPKLAFETNVLGVVTLLESARKFGIRRFHHVSTDEVFGSLDLDSEEKFTEDTPYNPRSPYSASKAASNHVARAYYTTFNVPVTITNCSNNFGPYQDVEKFLPRMITNLIDGEQIPIYGDGKYMRDWLHVEDHVAAIELVLKKSDPGEVFVVGGKTGEISNIDIARRLVKLFGFGEEKIKFVKDRPGHDRKYAVDWSKIKRELNYEPEKDFDEGLLDTIKWYQDNEWWWRPLKDRAEKLYTKTGQK